jgi:hypothetical protein
VAINQDSVSMPSVRSSRASLQGGCTWRLRSHLPEVGRVVHPTVA